METSREGTYSICATLLTRGVSVELTLGGDYDRMALPAGSSLASSLYVIERSHLDWIDDAPVLTAGGGEIVLKYQSSSPIVNPIDPRLPMTGNCEITSSPLGSGMAMFSALWASLDGVLSKAAVRNVVLLDGNLGFGDPGYLPTDSSIRGTPTVPLHDQLPQPATTRPEALGSYCLPRSLKPFWVAWPV